MLDVFHKTYLFDFRNQFHGEMIKLSKYCKKYIKQTATILGYMIVNFVLLDASKFNVSSRVP